MSLKEIQYLGQAQSGEIESRKERLISYLLLPLEKQLLAQEQSGPIIPRIKQLRAKLVPELNGPETTEERRSEIWDHLHDIYMAQQVWSYPTGYLDQPTDMRLLETVESFEEDLTDRARIHRPLHAILEVGEPIEAQPTRSQKQNGGDEIMRELAASLQSMLEQLSTEARAI